MARHQPPLDRCQIERSAGDASVTARLSGDWLLVGGMTPIEPLIQSLRTDPPPRRLVLRGEGIGAWDSSLPAFLVPAVEFCRARSIEVDTGTLPEGARRLVALSTLVPERAGTGRSGKRQGVVAAIGAAGIAWAQSARETVGFIGETLIALGRLLTGRARFPVGDFLLSVQECGVAALPIVSIISLLIGLILAFVGAVQLRQFGAQIYVADLVGIAMTREMGAVMTAIVLAGRTGAAFAARIGAMQGNEEIDALSVLGISPVEYLVLPRVLALVLMTPLLCLYADVVGMLGGYVVGSTMLGLNATSYLNQTQNTVTLTQFGIGLGKSMVFGSIVALAGCRQGMHSGRSAAAVGNATTAAVVQGILFIIIADGIFAIMLEVLHL